MYQNPSVLYYRELIFGFIRLPQSQNNHVLIVINLKNCCKPCLMHEYLAGKCKSQLGPIMCLG
jgi:hypothetical protein